MMLEYFQCGAVEIGYALCCFFRYVELQKLLSIRRSPSPSSSSSSSSPSYLCSISFRHDDVVPQKCPAVPASRWSPRSEVEGPSMFSIELHSRNRTITLEPEVHKDGGSSVEVRVMLDWTRGH